MKQKKNNIIMSLLFSTTVITCVTVTGWSLLRQRDHNVVGLVFGDLWPGIIFILSFIYFCTMAMSAKNVNKGNKLAWFYQMWLC